MGRHSFLGGCVIIAAAVAGCYTVDDVSMRSSAQAPASGTTTSVDGTDPSGNTVTGLPCSVARVIAKSCATCHAQTLSGGAPNRMLTYEDLAAISITDGVSTVAEVAVARMRAASGTMPPSGALEPKEVEAVAKWVAAGAPRGDCSDATVDPTNYDTPTVCSSKVRWTKGDQESPLMRPGAACIACHKIEDAPAYSAAGTIYPTAHEPNDCNGHSDTNVKVVITDAAGKTYTQSINAAGNFFFAASKYPIKFPYRAKIVSGSKTREMKDPQKDGDCNKCHSEKGNEDAPGRVMAP
jgi:mono/diheme cytochrome c family protein